MAAPASPPFTENPISNEVLRFVRSGNAEALSAQEILTWGLRNFPGRLALSCSFGAPEGLVALDMMHRIDATATRVFFLDTGRIPQETYDLIDRVRDRYDVAVEVVFPRAEAVQQMVRTQGLNLFYESVEARKLCCNLRKVEPLNRYLAEAGLDGWVTGLRRDQNQNRSEAAKIEIDAAHGGLLKLNPLADWTRERVLEYAEEHGVPLNRLHRQGYPSVGCAPCSRAVRPGEDERAGRWWWEASGEKECGIHVDEVDQGSGI